MMIDVVHYPRYAQPRFVAVKISHVPLHLVNGMYVEVLDRRR